LSPPSAEGSVAGAPVPNGGRRVGSGCLKALLISAAVLAATGGVGAWWWFRQDRLALEAQEEKAEAAFAPAREKLETTAGEDIDIDRTIRVLHQVDESMRHQDDLHTFLASVAAEDWRGVPREVLDAREEILDAQMKLYGKQVELDAQEASWTFSRDVVLTTLSVVTVSGEGGMTPDASFQVDRQAAERRLDELRSEAAERRALLRDVDELERALIDASMRYAIVWAKYFEAYDRVSYHRDRAWMAVGRKDWVDAETESRAAIAMAPHEREAHMLLAQSLIAQGGAERLDEAAALVEPFATGERAGAMAPALLLRGTIREARGDLAAARADFAHAALAYPTQAAQLDDVLDPYRMRSSLRKSRSGAGIVASYSATMVGAGAYSPELHLARMAFDRGDRDAGRAAVVDHFERRRAQQQWDYILADLAWAEVLLGDDFRSIFPEEAWLDLHAEKSLMGLGQTLSLSVDNRSQHTLKNAALVLCVRFTDMLGGDYVTFSGERTVPEVAAHSSTRFGKVDVDTEVFGETRTEDDIVEMRAILVTDGGVLWVDTEKYKVERRAAAREERRASPPAAEEADRWARMVDEAGRAASVQRSTGLVQDSLEVELPAELVWLRPHFSLRYGEATLDAESNVVEGDRIKLRFKGIGDLLSRDEPPRAADLRCESVFGSFVLSFAPDADGRWTFQGVRSEE
jgi:tetratricopeptide (TPR) repeat protein